MKLFQTITSIQQFETMQEFVQDFELSEQDFVLASKTIYESYLAPLNIKSKVVFKSDYGSSEPTDLMVDDLLADFRAADCNRIVAIGGGAVIDMAKLLVLDGRGSAADYFQRLVPVKKVRPLIAVPTTCGAGSEVSSVTIAEMTRLGTKLGLADDELYPDFAVLIPQLLSDLPFFYFSTSGVDALIHAAESYLSPRANLYTRMCSLKAIEMLIKGFQVIDQKGPEERRHHLEAFLTASNLAGVAFANAGTGAVHAMSYPLSAIYHVTHGEANYQFFTKVFSVYNNIRPDGEIKELTQFISGLLGCQAEAAYEQLERLFDRVIPRKKLRDYGVGEEEIAAFAKTVEETQQRLLNQSYVKFTAEQMQEIYRELY